MQALSHPFFAHAPVLGPIRDFPVADRKAGLDEDSHVANQGVVLLLFALADVVVFHCSSDFNYDAKLYINDYMQPAGKLFSFFAVIIFPLIFPLIFPIRFIMRFLPFHNSFTILFRMIFSPFYVKLSIVVLQIIF